MTYHANSFRGQTVGGNATAANSGNSGSAWTNDSLGGTSTAVWSNGHAVAGYGSPSLLITPETSPAEQAYNDDVSFSSTTCVVGDMFYVPSTPTINNIYIHNYRAGTEASSSSVAGIALTNTCKLVALGSGGSTLGTAAAACSVGWIYVTSQLTSASSGGSLPFQYYTWNGTTWTLVQSVPGSTGNTTGNTVTMIRRGCTSSSFAGAIPGWEYGFTQTQDGSTTPLSPLSPFFPTPPPLFVPPRAAIIRANHW